MKTLDLEQLKELKPCEEGLKWYVKNIKTENIREILLQVNNHREDWARWLFAQLLNREQSIKVAIYSARLVLHMFEEKFPNDSRARKAIEAAEKYIDETSEENRLIAAAAAYAAAAADAYAAAADTDAAAAYTAADAVATNKKEVQEKILNHIADLLEGAN